MAKNSRRCRKRRRNGLPWANVTLELDNPHQRTTPHIQTNTVTGQAETDSPGEKPGLYDRIMHDSFSLKIFSALRMEKVESLAGS